jgi:hypothetical protein
VDGDASDNWIRVDVVGSGEFALQRISYHVAGDIWVDVGEYTAFEFDSLLINSGAGSDLVDIDALVAPYHPLTINGVNGQDTVDLYSLCYGAPVTVMNPGGYTDLNITDPAGEVASTTTVGPNSLTLDHPGFADSTFVVNYTSGDISGLHINLGNAAHNIVAVNGTPSAAQLTTIQTGTGGTAVQVNGNTRPLAIDDHGHDGVDVGYTGHLTSIQAPVSVNGNGTATDLLIDDVFDSADRTVSITSDTVAFGDPIGPIHYSNLHSLTVQGGSGADLVNVLSTSTGTTFNGAPAKTPSSSATPPTPWTTSTPR